MATRVIPFTATIPAGTPKTTPATIPLALDNWEIQRLDLEVPPGPAGLMGFQVYNNGVAWIPYGVNEWLVWDDVKDSYYFTDQPDASGWAVVGYNTGTYDHAVTVRFHVNPVSTPSTSASPPAVTFITTPAPAPQPFVLGT